VRSWPILALISACFAATPPAGVPCDPAAPACPDGQACIASAAGFACLAEGTPPFDAAVQVDAAPEPACSNDAKLSVCFSFDALALASPLPNEGRSGVNADLVAVTRIAHADGGAAQIGTTSSILIPPNAEVVDIAATEASIRLDAAIPDGTRMGVLDTDGADPGLSLFVFGVAGGHQVRCNLGDVDVFADVAITPGEWIDFACSCKDNVVSVLVNGTKVAEGTGCVPALGTVFGVQIGQNSRGLAGLPENEHLVGAIDNVRMWTRPL
jgi:hypothetical protein